MPISHPRLYEHTRHMSPTEVPDCVWPSDNEMEVPMLRPDLQANAVDLPVTQWGTIRRRSDMHGTWSFYVDDYRFTALWRDPTPVINSGCLNVVEPNFSCSDQTPFPVVLNNIYRKRWLSRFWQEFGGVRVTLLDSAIPVARN